MFVDSHCHLDRYPREQLSKLIDEARIAGIDTMVSMGMTLESSKELVSLAQAYDAVQVAVGIHPWNAVLPTPEIKRTIAELTGVGVVAIGEIGLDYARCPKTKEIQKELIMYELSLAQETGLPLSIHCREAHQDMMHILRQKGLGLKGTIHGFSGDSVALTDWLDLGFYISIGIRGFVIDEMPALSSVIRGIPLERLLTETDSAGGDISPLDVVLVVQKLASIRGDTVEEIASATSANLKRLLTRDK